MFMSAFFLQRFVFTMRSLQGALIIAGVFQAVIGFFGIWRVFIRFLSPLAAVPFVTLSALGLFYFAFPGVAKCIEIGLPTLVLLIIFAEVLLYAYRNPIARSRIVSFLHIGH
jgi:nucleobase transporter 1/2